MKKLIIILSTFLTLLLGTIVQAETVTPVTVAFTQNSIDNIASFKLAYPYYVVVDKGDGNYRFMGTKQETYFKSDNSATWFFKPINTTLTKVDMGIASGYPIADTMTRQLSAQWAGENITTGAYSGVTNLKVIESSIIIRNYDGTDLYTPPPAIPELDLLQHYIAVSENRDNEDSIYSNEDIRMVDFSFNIPADKDTISIDSIRYKIGENGTKQPLETTVTHGYLLENGLATGDFTIYLPITKVGLNTTTVYLYDQWDREISTLVQMNNQYRSIGSVPDVTDTDGDGQADNIVGEAPKRTNYPDGILGTVEYSFDLLFYYITYPFRAIANGIMQIREEIQGNFTWITEFAEFAKTIMSIFPPPVTGLISVVLMSAIILAIVRLLR